MYEEKRRKEIMFERRERVYSAILKLTKYSGATSVRDISAYTGSRSLNTTYNDLKFLREQGKIEWIPESRKKTIKPKSDIS